MGEVVFITDIHGEYEKLRELLDLLHSNSYAPDSIVFGGDYIDRGRDSRKVLQTVISYVKKGARAIPGNHEVMALEAVRELRKDCSLFSFVYGVHKETFKSYGIKRLSEGKCKTKRKLKRLQRDIEFITREEKWYVEEEGIVFVHGGFDQRKNWKKTPKENMVWNRPERDSSVGIDKVIAKGHTPLQKFQSGKGPVEPMYLEEKDMWFCDGGASLGLGGSTLLACVFCSVTGKFKNYFSV